MYDEMNNSLIQGIGTLKKGYLGPRKLFSAKCLQSLQGCKNVLTDDHATALLTECVSWLLQLSDMIRYYDSYVRFLKCILTNIKTFIKMNC